MANRSLAAKAERAARQRREAAAAEYSKPAYLGWRDGVGLSKVESRALIASYDGPIVRLPNGKATGLADSIGVMGKGRRRAAERTYGDGTRRTGGLLYGAMVSASELIKA